MSSVPKRLIAVNYEEHARQYLSKLPPEHFMESTAQATQRLITLASLALVVALCKNVHLFNELLIQYPLPGRKKRPGQVVPDNMIVIADEKPVAEGSYNTPVESAPPFWVLEYVSKSNKRKDYEDNFRKYEQELKVAYYLLFYPETQDLTLYHHTGEKYVSVKPNAHGRYAVPELDIEVALLGGWVRFWYKGELLLLPADLQRGLDEARRQASEQKQRADRAEQRAGQAEQRADDLQTALRAAQEEIVRLRALAGERSEDTNP